MSENYTGTDNLEVMAEAVNYNRFLINSVLSHAKPGDQIVDFGAGIGTFAKQVADKGFSVWAIETDLAQSKSISEAGLKVFHDLDSLPDMSVDYLYSLNVLEHIENDSAIMNKISSKLKVGGRLYLYVPAFNILFTSMDRKVGHYRRYTRKTLRQVVRGSGIVVESVEYADSAGFFATLLFKWLGNDSGDLNLKALVFYDRFLFPISRAADFIFRRLFGKNVMLKGVR